MGFFGGGSTTVVSSTIYNMAGDVNKRPDFLKSTITASIIGDDVTQSIGDTIQNSYINGPGITLRSFYKWAAGSSGYEDVVGFTAGNLITGNSINDEVLADQIRTIIGATDDYTVQVQASDLGYADISWWAEQFILANHPELLETAWHCDYLNGLGVITYADGSQESFAPAGFDPNGKYLFSAYTLNSGTSMGQVIPGDTVTLGAGQAMPATDGWSVDSSVFTPQTFDFVTTVTTAHTYSDGQAPDSNTVVTHHAGSGMQTSAVFEKLTFLGIDPTDPKRTHSTRQIMYQDQSAQVVTGAPVVTTSTNLVAGSTTVTVTQTVTTTVQTTQQTRTYRIDTQDVTNSSQSVLQVFIYPFGSGNPVLDAMFNPPSDMGKFFPYIPVRIDDKMLSDGYNPAVYAAAKKAYYKATKNQLDDLITTINDNPSVGDIDYAYIVFGVSVNVAEVASKKYIFAFFDAIMNSASFPHDAYAQFKSQWGTAVAFQERYNDWVLANSGSDTPTTDRPSLVAYPVLPTQSIEIKTSSNTNLNFDMLISWNGIEAASGAGIVDPAHKVGDIWWKINGADTFTRQIRTSNDVDGGLSISSFQVPYVTLYWQVDINNWKALNIYGLLHQNFVYGGKSVDTSITDAINDTEESGFIIPLNEEIFQSTSLKDSTQMATACVYIVFNSYQIVTKKWYQTGIFAVIVIIVIIIITYFTWGAGSGLYAAYGAIGTSLGFTGVAALVVGFAVSMVAGMIVSQVLGYTARKIFGDKVGAIIGAIATVVVMVVGGEMAGGGSFTAGLSQLTSPANLLKLTASLTNGISDYLGDETQDVINQTNQLLDQYNTESQSIADQYASVLGSDMGQFNPLQLTDPTAPPVPGQNYTYESSDTFLSRTLMTGMDIAELDSTLITQFTSLTLDLAQTLPT